MIAITEASEITNTTVAEWMKGSNGIQQTSLPASSNQVNTKSTNSSFMASTNSTIKLSQDFIYAAKTDEKETIFTEKLRSLDYNTLKSTLKTDDEKKAFWINLYNGYTQLLLKQNPEQYKDRKSFFTSKKIQVAGKTFSLDDIEHGILRRSKIKWSLGYLNKLFPGTIEKDLRVKNVDERIHFALNCGAKSCPPIAFYAPEKLDMQLDLAAKNYLNNEVEYKESEDIVYLPAIIGWFRNDFDGKKGMKGLLQKYGFTSIKDSTKIKFKPYDWTLFLQNYTPNT